MPAPDERDPNADYRRLIRALRHPLRAQILGVLRERRASPKELAEELGAPLGNVSYHVRVLARLELIGLVKKTPRRGAIEHHYEALAVAEISGEAWATVPAATKHAVVGAALGEIGRAVNRAASVGGFEREDVHLTRTRPVLDERGWVELAGELTRTLELAERIERRSAERLTSSDHVGELRATLVQMFFENPARLEAPRADGPGEHDCPRSGRLPDAPRRAQRQ